MAGARDAARRLGIGAPRVHRGEMTEAVGEEIAGRVLAEGGRPALACIQDSFAFGAFRAAGALAPRIGTDAMLCGGHNFPGSEHTAPPLTTFSIEDARVAARLSGAMLAPLDGKGQWPFKGEVLAPEPLLRRPHLLDRADRP